MKGAGDVHVQPVIDSPPSTGMTAPLTKSNSLPARPTIALATSCGVVIRPVGLRRSLSSMICWWTGTFMSAGVIAMPAWMALTVIPVRRCPNSRAS